jgi:hypothetical protein
MASATYLKTACHKVSTHKSNLKGRQNRYVSTKFLPYASSAVVSAAARAVNWPGRRDAHTHAILIRAASAYNARPRMQWGSNVLAPPPRPSIPQPPRCASLAAFAPHLVPRLDLQHPYNDNTKDKWSIEEKEGVGDEVMMEVKHNT